MAQHHRGIRDNLTAELDGNQEVPPKDTNTGSAHRITSPSFLLSVFSISRLLSSSEYHTPAEISFIASSVLLSFSAVSPSSVFPFYTSFVLLIFLPALIITDSGEECACTAFGVCFHTSAWKKKKRKRKRVCAKVTELLDSRELHHRKPYPDASPVTPRVCVCVCIWTRFHMVDISRIPLLTSSEFDICRHFNLEAKSGQECQQHHM